MMAGADRWHRLAAWVSKSDGDEESQRTHTQPIEKCIYVDISHTHEQIRRIGSRLASRSIADRSLARALLADSCDKASLENFLSHPPTPENGLVRKELVLVNNGVEHLDR